ncbi:SPFH domain-containing protein [Thalassobellus citreus]|uniref:SPFH domain-containing protein n=1 Tax=Thalassobellus citreus TaxID=3367752 RepID=UPI00379F2A92
MDGIKEFFTYITNQFKFWFIVKEWENGLQLRNGKIIRVLKNGIYFKIPFLDAVFCQPKRTQDVIVSQVNFTTKDNKQITASATAFFKIIDIKEYYNGYAEPLSIIDGFIKNEIARYFLLTRFEDFDIDVFEKRVLNHLQLIKGKGMLFEDFKLITFSNAKTFRIIHDKLYSQINSELDKQVF